MNVKTIFNVARFEFWQTLQRKSALFVMFGMPILSFLVMTGFNRLARPSDDGGDGGAGASDSILSQFALDSDEAVLPSGVIDETGEMAEMPAELSDLFFIFSNEMAAQEAINAGTIEDYYIIPADFLDTGEVDYFAERQSLFDFKEDLLYDHLVVSYVQDPVLAEQITTRLVINETDLSATEEITDQSFGEAYLLAIAISVIFYMTTMGAAGYLMQSLGKEKQNRVMELLLSSVRPMELLTGKVFGLGAIGLLQVVIWGLLGTFVLGRGGSTLFSNIPMPQLAFGTWITILGYFMLGFLVYASLFAGVGAIAPSPKESQQVTFFLMFPTFLPMWFMSVFLSAPNGTFATVLSLVPLTAPIAMPVRMVLTSVPTLHIVASILFALLGALATLWVATRIFRSQTLLSGRGISPATIWEAIKG